MKEHNQLKHRGKGTAAQCKKHQSLKANAANEIYSWDITYLLSPIKGQYYYLYIVMDIYSQKIVGWQAHDCESSAHAADLIEDIARREKIDKNQLVIHSDNGGPIALSCDGIPNSKSNSSVNHVSFALPNLSMATQLSAPQIVAHRVINNMSESRCVYLLLGLQ